MSYSIVRTCSRCGTRAEREIRTGQELAAAVFSLQHHLQHRDGDQGCPSCMPELARAAEIDVDEWRAAVNRALSRRTQ